MVRQVINAVRTAAGRIANRPGALGLAFLLYLALAGVVYLFFATREATVWQLVLTVVLPVVAVVLFFALQSVGIRYTQSNEGTGALLRRSMVDCWRLLAVSLPVIVLAVIGLFGFVLIEFLLTKDNAAAEYGFVYTRVMPALRMVLLLLVVPLIAIQMWIASTRDGVRIALRGMLKSFRRAFAPGLLITYLVISLVFGAIAYCLIFTRTPVANAWLDIALLIARLTLAGITIFVGWMLGLGAMREAAENKP